MSTLEASVLAAYYALLVLLGIYGVHRVLLLRRRLRVPDPGPLDPASTPVVTIQLPIYNELFVAPRLLDAVARFDYPIDRLEIQVLDDSTDATSDLIAERIDHWRRAGLDVVHLRRPVRSGYKAGALAAGTACARGDLLAVFDADFVPPANFLQRTVPHFADAGVGMVQARWTHLNREHSLLTRLQAVLLDGHFLVEQAARAAAGRFFNFNGTAGVWRKRAIVEAGGWQHDTLTEDMDLSYRAQLAGWRFLFLPDLEVPAELPAEMAAYRSQQRRWTQGATQTLRKLWRPLLTAPVPWTTRAEALLHLSSNLTYPLMVLLSLLLPISLFLRQRWGIPALAFLDIALLGGATVTVWSFYTVAERRAGRPLGAALLAPAGLMALGIGMSAHNAWAALRGLAVRGGTFERTPKVPIRLEAEESGPAAAPAAGYRAAPSAYPWLEAAIAAYLGLALVRAWQWGMFWELPFLALFFSGYALTASWSLREWLSALRWERTLRPATAEAHAHATPRNLP